MRNGYNQQQHKGTTFSLPNLCSKPSMINDVYVPTNPAGRCSDDPSLSPKVGCMGQVKKKNLQQNYKQLGMVFPTNSTNNNASTASAAVGFGHSSYLRLKTLLTSTPSVLATTATSKTKTTTSCRKSHHRNRLRSRSCEDAGAIGGFGSLINVADLDPPLPVIIKKKTTSAAALVSDSDNNNSLWKRRSGGAALKGLQIQLQVHIPIIQPSISIC